MKRWFLHLKAISLFLAQAIAFALTQKKIYFPALSAKRSSIPLTLDPIILDAFKHNQFSSVQHCLLYEPAFEHKKIDEMIIAYFKGNRTDIYWGDFVSIDKNVNLTKVGKAIEKALVESKQQSRFCVFMDVNVETANAIEKLKLPLIKVHLGNEWITEAQKFDLDNKKSHAFRNALSCAKRNKLSMVEVGADENCDSINEMILNFSQSRGLLFPRINAAIVKKYVYHPLIFRRIWKITNFQGIVIGVVVICKIGIDYYYFEHAVYTTKYRFLLDWCLSQILLILKKEGVTYVSWGRMANLLTKEELDKDPNLWIIHALYRIKGIEKFTKNSLKFKLDFVPIHKEPKWFFYSDFRADTLLDILPIIGNNNIFLL